MPSDTKCTSEFRTIYDESVQNAHINVDGEQWTDNDDSTHRIQPYDIWNEMQSFDLTQESLFKAELLADLGL